MSTRYGREVEKRIIQIASDASDLDELRRPPDHPPHAPGECVECDARRHLRLASGPGGESLHHIRVRLGGRREREQRRREEFEDMKFEAAHPEYRKKVEDYLEASSRWVSEGGRRPRPPSTEYDDYPRPTRRWTWLDSLVGTRRGLFLARVYVLKRRLRGR